MFFSKDRLCKMFLHAGRMGSFWPITFAFIPTFWGFIKNNNDIKILDFTVLMFGTWLGRTAGCIFNEFCDKKIDACVERTKNRFFQIYSPNFWELLLAASLILFFILVIFYFLNKTAIVISFLAIFLAFLYPFAKRFSNYPQIFLALVFNIGCFVGWAQQDKYILDPKVWLIYGFCSFWVLAYDTVYAFQDYEDDLKNNFGSLSVVAGSKGKLFIAIFWMLTLAFYCFLGNMLSLILGAAFGAYMLYDLDIKDSGSCKKWFFNQKYMVLVFMIGIW